MRNSSGLVPRYTDRELDFARSSIERAALF